MHTTVGILDPPLGNTRLQVVRLMSAVLQCSSTSIANEVIRLKTFTNLLVSVSLSLSLSLSPSLPLPPLFSACIFLPPFFPFSFQYPNFHLRLIELGIVSCQYFYWAYPLIHIRAYFRCARVCFRPPSSWDWLPPPQLYEWNLDNFIHVWLHPQDLFFAYPWNNFLHMTVESCIMAALFTIPPPPSLSSSSSSSLPASAAATPTASQEGGGASQSNEGEDGQENSSGNMNHKSLRHHVSTKSEGFFVNPVMEF